MEDMTSWVGILVFGCGLYCLYAAYQLKVKGIVNVNILLNKSMACKKCKDIEGYTKEMFPVLLVFALLTTACGAIDIINSFVMEIPILYFVSLGLFLASFILFAMTAKKTREKYYTV